MLEGGTFKIYQAINMRQKDIHDSHLFYVHPLVLVMSTLIRSCLGRCWTWTLCLLCDVFTQWTWAFQALNLDLKSCWGSSLTESFEIRHWKNSSLGGDQNLFVLENLGGTDACLGVPMVQCGYACKEDHTSCGGENSQGSLMEDVTYAKKLEEV